MVVEYDITNSNTMIVEWFEKNPHYKKSNLSIVITNYLTWLLWQFWTTCNNRYLLFVVDKSQSNLEIIKIL